MFFSSPRTDVVAGAVVFLVALPLCLGIAVACGVPPVSGLIAGIVGGMVVPLISRAPLSVSGPAAGLTSIVLLELSRLSLPQFLTAVVLAGVFQLVFGAIGAGKFSTLVPGSVIKGMLAAIGITILLKQLPVAVGSSASWRDIDSIHFGSLLLSLLALVILIVMPKTALKRFTFLPPALVVVVVCTLAAGVIAATTIGLPTGQFVSVPGGGFSGLWAALPHPIVDAASMPGVWVAALTIALVASIETLLSLQAVDGLDPLSRQSPPNRELMAQGVGNIISGLLGGLPITSVIVRSGANVTAGGRERLSAFVHGVLLLVAVVAAAGLLNMIPLAALAAVLIMIGFNLAKPSMFVSQFRLGASQWVPFVATIAGVLGLDLLKGVVIGIIVAIAMNVRGKIGGVVDTQVGTTTTVRFLHDATFLSKLHIAKALSGIAPDSSVLIDATGMKLDHDVKDQLADFVRDGARQRIHTEVKGVTLSSGSSH